MEFRPCIDLHHGKVKQIVGSTYCDANGDTLITHFESDDSPARFAELYRQDELRGGHVVMIGPGNDDAARQALQAFPGGLQVGGGVTAENAKKYLDFGASHVVVTSFVFRKGLIAWDNLKRIFRTVGKKRLVLDLSCKFRDRRYVIVTDRWQRATDVEISNQTLECLAAYCDEFLVHAAHVEGKQSGVDAALIELLAVGSPIPVTYAGGIRSLSDFQIIKQTGDNRVHATVGSALDIFGGPLPYGDVVLWFREHGYEK
ncbi:MAG: phosphoribosylformimino-5-aminoimidazole carboxamide ribotide isomerase [Chitinivibrionales bacterium]|nr:phosphoribosylformimino-5-aminoimidazole carboxamide ribotide isomerase [Chitinivibrionales bacterium]